MERRFPVKAPAPVPEVPVAREEFRQRRILSREEKKLRSRIDFLEKEIAKTEDRMKQIEAQLASPGPETDVMELTRSYLEDKRDLDARIQEWETLMGKMEE